MLQNEGMHEHAELGKRIDAVAGRIPDFPEQCVGKDGL